MTASRLVQEVRYARNEVEAIDAFGYFDCLVIDDIAVDVAEPAIRILTEVLDIRLSNDHMTIFSSNGTPEELLSIFGPRGYSRLFANALIIPLTGIDHRLARTQIVEDTGKQALATAPHSAGMHRTTSS